MQQPLSVLRTIGALVAFAALLALVTTPAAGTPPKGKHYAVILILLDPPTGELDVVPACLSFTKNEMCTTDGECGPFAFVEKAGHQNEWTASLDFVNEEGVPIHAELQGMTERAGAGNSIGGTVLYSVEEFLFNGSFSGTRLPRSECIEFGSAESG